MSETKYKQCVLEKTFPGGTVLKQTSWIPEKYAVGGIVLKLLGDDGWRVVRVGPNSLVSSSIDPRAAIKKHRKSTGDAMPKSRQVGRARWHTETTGDIGIRITLGNPRFAPSLMR